MKNHQTSSNLFRFLSGYALAALLAVGMSFYPLSQIAKAKEINPAVSSLQALVRSPIASEGPLQGNLYSPTYMVYLDGKWFIVDCWNNRVLWQTDPNLPVSQWRLMDGALQHPHSIAYGDGVFAVEDTEGARLNLYKFDQALNVFVRQNSLELPAGSRPHRTVFDDKTKTFLTLGSMDQTLYRVDANRVEPAVTESYKLDFINGYYTRSFSLYQDKLYFVSELQAVVEAVIADGRAVELARYPVPEKFKSANDLFFTGRGFVMTATLGETGQGVIGTASSLAGLAGLEDQSEQLGFRSVPYYVSQYDQTVIIPEVSNFSAIKLLEINDKNQLQSKQNIYDFYRSKRR